MSYSRLILKDYPDIVWPLDNISSSSTTSNAINFFTSSKSDYAASINTGASKVVNIPIVHGGGTALIMTSSSAAGLKIPLLGRFSERYATRESSMSFWLRCDSVPANEITIAKKRNFNNIGIFLKENYITFRYGTSSYVQVIGTIFDNEYPNHVVINTSTSGIEMIVNGVSYSSELSGVSLPQDLSHSSNDYMDFYGSEKFDIIIDCPAIFSYRIDTPTAKRHFIYGLGSSIDESIFFNLGGDFYNLSTSDTRKSYSSEWNYPDDWRLIRYDNLVNNIDDGITSRQFSSPILYSYDNLITKSSNSIRLSSSAGNTLGSYITIQDLQEIFEDNNQVNFYVKIRLDGELPKSGNRQTIFSYGNSKFNEGLVTSLYNNSGSYSFMMESLDQYYMASISIPTVSSSPTIIVGYKYDGVSTLYMSMSGSLTSTASFQYYSGSSYSVDPMTERFPVTSLGEIRIGSRMLFDSTTGPTYTSSVNQFYGSFIRFMAATASIDTSSYSSIDSYQRYPYSFTHSTSENRFMVRSFGNANFIIHGGSIADEDISGSARISSNRIEFGYPDVLSGSQVKIYLTVYDYSNNIINAKTQLSRVNHIEYINSVDLSNRYLMFDIDIDAVDTFYRPPSVKSFIMETYPYTGSYTKIYDDGGDAIKIYSASNSRLLLPEINNTPTVLVGKNSGIRIYRNLVDFEFSPAEKSFIMPSAGSMSLWLDARYINGLYRTQPDDLTITSSWKDISSSSVPTTSNSSSWPQYRVQSLNLLQLSHSLGGDTASTRNVSGSNVSFSTSLDVSQSEDSSFKLVPNGTSNNSFISLGSMSTASLNEGILPNSTYTIVGTAILLSKQQSASLNTNSRRIVISSSGASDYMSSQAPNEIGANTVSATFTTSSALVGNSIRLYNGSSSSADIVYWDNIALYSGSTVSGSPVQWYAPFEHYNDRNTIRFYTSSAFMTASMSIKQPMTVYMVARSFGNGAFIGGQTASAPSIYVESGSVTMSSGSKIYGSINNNDFNIIVAVFNNNSSSLFVGNSVYTGNAGTGSYTSAGMTIGRAITGSSASSYLNGDISMIAVYNSAHSKSLIDTISTTIKDEFNVS